MRDLLSVDDLDRVAIEDAQVGVLAAHAVEESVDHGEHGSFVARAGVAIPARLRRNQGAAACQ